MADNLRYTNPATGTDIATKDIAGVHYAKNIVTGSTGAIAEADATYGLDVDVTRAAADSTGLTTGINLNLETATAVLGNGQNVVSVNIKTGSVAWTGTFAVTGSIDGINFFTIPAYDESGTAATLNANGNYFIPCQGLQSVVLTAGSWSAGDAQVYMRASQAIKRIQSSSTAPVGGATSAIQTDGTQKSIVRGGAKGTAVAADVTSAATDANTQSLHTHVVNFPATQPVSATSLPLPTGAATESTLSTLNGKVTACNTGAVTISAALPAGTANIGDVDVLTLPVLTQRSSNAAVNTVVGNVSLGNSQDKTVQMKTGSLVTTAVTADQVILTFTVTAGKTFYLQYISVNCRLTTFATTATNFGTYSLESPSGTKLFTGSMMAAGDRNPDTLFFAEPIPIATQGVVIRLVCTPSAATSFTWFGSFGGYER